MSTFNGLVAEFPDIRGKLKLGPAILGDVTQLGLTDLPSAVDFFRSHPNLRPPLACFLGHIHSDHLAGLESLRAPLYVPPLSLAEG